MITRLEAATGGGGGAVVAVPDVAPAPATGFAPVGWVLLLTMSAADSTQFWQFWTYSSVRW